MAIERDGSSLCRPDQCSFLPVLAASYPVQSFLTGVSSIAFRQFTILLSQFLLPYQYNMSESKGIAIVTGASAGKQTIHSIGRSNPLSWEDMHNSLAVLYDVIQVSAEPVL